jgi:TetR/AcrR family fatty acid metabolism transcriptional regulator
MKDAIQEQLIAARRTQILEAAARVFASKGFHATTIKDIARDAGIADGTIYNYFANKTALLFGLLEQMRQTAMQAPDVQGIDMLDLRSFLRMYLRQPLLTMKQNNFALFRVVISELLVNEEVRTEYYRQILEPTLQLAEPMIQMWAAEKRIKPTDARLLIRTLSALVMGLMIGHIMGDPVLDAEWEVLPDFLATLLLDGLKPE